MVDGSRSRRRRSRDGRSRRLGARQDKSGDGKPSALRVARGRVQEIVLPNGLGSSSSSEHDAPVVAFMTAVNVGPSRRSPARRASLTCSSTWRSRARRPSAERLGQGEGRARQGRAALREGQGGQARQGSRRRPEEARGRVPEGPGRGRQVRRHRRVLEDPPAPRRRGAERVHQYGRDRLPRRAAVELPRAVVLARVRPVPRPGPPPVLHGKERRQGRAPHARRVEPGRRALWKSSCPAPSARTRMRGP